MELKKLDGVRFANSKFRKISVIVTGWAIYEEGKGYYAFSHERDRFGLLIPYMPCKKALQCIIDDGGFCGMEGMEFVNPSAAL